MKRTLSIYVLGVSLLANGAAWADDHGHGPKGKGGQVAKHEDKQEKKTIKAVEKQQKKAAVRPVRPIFVRPVRPVVARPAPLPAMRFRGLDVDHNGIITRDEWRGNDVSFREHDWNHDRVLSGNEVRTGAARPNTAVAPRFVDFDRNRNGVITRDEWRGDMGVFNRLDRDRNSVLTPAEFSVRWW